MGIEKSVILSTGVDANFWKIDKASLDLVNLKLVIQISLYLDQNSADDGKDSLGKSVTYSLDITPDQITPDILNKLYQKIIDNDPGLKKLDQFKIVGSS